LGTLVCSPFSANRSVPKLELGNQDAVNLLLPLALFLNLLGFAEMALFFGYGTTSIAPISAGFGFVFGFAFSAFHGTAASF
jgi:hypothetical protein